MDAHLIDVRRAHQQPWRVGLCLWEREGESGSSDEFAARYILLINIACYTVTHKHTPKRMKRQNAAFRHIVIGRGDMLCAFVSGTWNHQVISNCTIKLKLLIASRQVDCIWLKKLIRSQRISGHFWLETRDGIHEKCPKRWFFEFIIIVILTNKKVVAHFMALVF